MKGNEKQWLMGECMSQIYLCVQLLMMQLKMLCYIVCLASYRTYHVWLWRRFMFYILTKGQLNERCKCKHTLSSSTYPHTLIQRETTVWLPSTNIT